MKIFWLGKFDGNTWRAEYPLVKGVQNAGGKVTTRDYYNLYDDFVPDANRHDIILVQNGKNFPFWWANRITRPIVFFASEAHWQHAKGLLKEFKKHVHGVVAHSTQVYDHVKKEYPRLHLTRIHNGYDPKVYKELNVRPVYDVSFIGFNSPRRTVYIDVIRSRYPNSIVAQCYGKDANRIYNQSKVTLHIHAIDQTYLPTRLFEVMPTNAFLVCEDIGNNWDGSFTLEGIRFFRGVNGCLEAVRSALDSDSSRIVSVSERKKSAYKNTWNERGKQFFDFIKDVYENPVSFPNNSIEQSYKNAKYF